MTFRFRFILILLPAFIFLANLIACTQKSNSKSEDLQSLAKQIDEIQTHEEFHSQESKILQKKKEVFSFNRFDDVIEVCDALSNLTGPRLLMMYDEITDRSSFNEISSGPYRGQFSKCADQLDLKIQNYLQESDRKLAANFSSNLKEKLSPCKRNGQEVNSSATLGPSEIHYVSLSHGKPLVGHELSRCQINITIDDGPHPRLTPQLLEILSAQNVQANFFVVGHRVRKSPNLVVAESDNRHAIGNHTLSHKDLSKLKFGAAINEIEMGFASIEKVLGSTLPFFRFPYGAGTKRLRANLKNNSNVEFLWNMDTLDWKIKDPEILFDHVLEEIEREKGGIILFHDVQPQTIVVFPYFLEALRLSNYVPAIVHPDVEEIKDVH